MSFMTSEMLFVAKRLNKEKRCVKYRLMGGEIVKINRSMGIKLTEKVTGKTYDENCNRDVKICYSIENIIDDCEKIMSLLLIFGIAGYLRECAVCYVVIGLTRTYLGGVHMRSWLGCTFMTIAVHICAVVCGTQIDIKNMCGLIFIGMLLLMVLAAPLPSPQRPLYRGRKRIKIKCRGIIGILIALTGYFVIDNFGNYILWVLLLEIIEVVSVVVYRTIVQMKNHAWKKSVE